jgi:hypothetical protein
MNYAVETGSGVMIYIQSQMLLGGRRHTGGNVVSYVHFF